MEQLQTIQQQHNPRIDAQSIIASAGKSPHTARAYGRAVASAQAAGVALFDFDQLATYAETLTNAQRAHLKAAVSLVATAVAQQLKTQATPNNTQATQAFLWRLEAAPGAVRVKRAKGSKTHKWLSRLEFEKLVSLPDASTTRGQRDRLALMLMGDCGLRRAEATAVVAGDVVYQNGGMVLKVVGKGGKERAVALHPETLRLMGLFSPGRVLRNIDRHGNVGDGLHPRSLADMVGEWGAVGGWPGLAPHDLRRTAAQIRYTAGWSLVAVQTFLGHASIETTRRYLQAPAANSEPLVLRVS